MEEKVIGIINALYTKGSRYNIVFTDRRLIGDYVGSSGGAWIVGGVIGVALSERHLKKKSQEFTKSVIPDDILGKHKKNFSIDYLSIMEATLTKKMLILKLYQKIKKIGKSIVIAYSRKQLLEEVEPMVMKVLPNITTIKY